MAEHVPGRPRAPVSRRGGLRHRAARGDGERLPGDRLRARRRAGDRRGRRAADDARARSRGRLRARPRRPAVRHPDGRRARRGHPTLRDARLRPACARRRGAAVLDRSASIASSARRSSATIVPGSRAAGAPSRRDTTPARPVRRPEGRTRRAEAVGRLASAPTRDTSCAPPSRCPTRPASCCSWILRTATAPPFPGEIEEHAVRAGKYFDLASTSCWLAPRAARVSISSTPPLHAAARLARAGGGDDPRSRARPVRSLPSRRLALRARARRRRGPARAARAHRLPQRRRRSRGDPRRARVQGAGDPARDVSSGIRRRPPGEVSALASARSLPGDYLLYVGARKRLKNLTLVLEALSRMPAPRPALVLSGPLFHQGDCAGRDRSRARGRGIDPVRGGPARRRRAGLPLLRRVALPAALAHRELRLAPARGHGVRRAGAGGAHRRPARHAGGRGGVLEPRDPAAWAEAITGWLADAEGLRTPRPSRDRAGGALLVGAHRRDDDRGLRRSRGRR